MAELGLVQIFEDGDENMRDKPLHFLRGIGDGAGKAGIFLDTREDIFGINVIKRSVNDHFRLLPTYAHCSYRFIALSINSIASPWFSCKEYL
jgi:hypothetical protein